MKSKQLNLLHYLFAIFFVYANGSWLFFDKKSLITSLVVVFLIVCIIIQYYTDRKIYQPKIIMLLMATWPIITLIANINNEPNFLSVALITISYFLISFLSESFLYSILDKFANIIFVLAGFTLIITPLSLIIPSFWSYFQVRHNTDYDGGFGYYNLYIYTSNVVNTYRVQSIFWEPGAWAFNQTFALFWFLFVSKNIKGSLVLILSLFLTFSTTGLVTLIILIAAAHIKIKDEIYRKKLRLITLLSTILLVLFSVYLTSNTENNVFEILQKQFFQKFDKNSETYDSYLDRRQSTEKALDVSIDNPIFGISRRSNENMLFVTSSLAEIIYQFGIIYLGVYLFVFVYAFRKLGYLISIILVIILLNGEAYSFLSLATLIVAFGARSMSGILVSRNLIPQLN